MNLSEITGDIEERLHVSFGEFSRVLGEGIVPGSIVLISGDPGIDKQARLKIDYARLQGSHPTVMPPNHKISNMNLF